MKKWILALIIIILTVNLTGCDAVQRKFTRKKKNVVKKPRFYQLKKYTKKPSPELYKQHFAYWESWQAELMQYVGQNHKKDVRAIEEATGHLKDLQNILIPSKAEEMQPHVEKMEYAKEIIYRGDLSFANKDYVRSLIEREDRAIKRDFCYSKVRDSLRKNTEEEEAPRLTMAVGKGEPVEQPKK
ncbi:MAG: hypothetical protein WCY36_04835 [Candidatus Omnitrophota bacterium]